MRFMTVGVALFWCGQTDGAFGGSLILDDTKRRLITINLLCVTYQKNEDLFYTAAEARNHAQCIYILRSISQHRMKVFEWVMCCEPGSSHSEFYLPKST